MNILELEEGLRNLIATQPAILKGENSNVVTSIKNIIEAHKAFLYSVEEYPENDTLKLGVINESAKLELNLISYVCQVLQERGINIMLYVPKYAAVYDKEISKYVDKAIKLDESTLSSKITDDNSEQIKKIEKKDEKFISVEKNLKEEIEVKKEEKTTKSKGRDYLMELLKK